MLNKSEHCQDREWLLMLFFKSMTWNFWGWPTLNCDLSAVVQCPYHVCGVMPHPSATPLGSSLNTPPRPSRPGLRNCWRERSNAPPTTAFHLCDTVITHEVSRSTLWTLFRSDKLSEREKKYLALAINLELVSFRLMSFFFYRTYLSLLDAGPPFNFLLCKFQTLTHRLK